MMNNPIDWEAVNRWGAERDLRLYEHLNPGIVDYLQSLSVGEIRIWYLFGPETQAAIMSAYINGGELQGNPVLKEALDGVCSQNGWSPMEIAFRPDTTDWEDVKKEAFLDFGRRFRRMF